MILIGSLITFTNSAWAQSEDVEISIGVDLKDLKEIDRRLQDYEILKEIDKAKDDRIRNLEKDLAVTKKELEIEKGENEINRKMVALQEKEIELQRENFNQMKEIADRAIKLAETKKSSIWETYGPLAVIAVIVVTIASVF
jgi:hypothetical protein